MLFQLFRCLVNPLLGRGLSRFRLLHYTYRKIGSFMLFGSRSSKIVVVDGTKFHLTKRDKGLEGVADCLLMNNEYEPCTTNTIELFVVPGMFTIDVGANIGYYTLLLSKLVGDKGHVVAFEPEKNNLTDLLINVELNEARNVTVSKYAVSNCIGSGTLLVSKECSGEHSLVASRNKDMNFQQVKVVTLDSFIKGKVDFIKIDTEGNEAKVLLGARNLLSNNPNILLVVEAWPYGLANSGSSIEELWEVLDSFGFIYKCRLDDPNCKVYPVTLDYLKARSSKNNEAINLLCSKKQI